MTKKEEDIDLGKPSETEVVAEAIPAGQGNEPPIPAGHSRFYCSKCHTVRLNYECTVCFACALLCSY